MESKIRVKLGAIEVEYEGSEAFLKQEFLGLLSKLSEFYRTNKISANEHAGRADSGLGERINLSTASVAAKLGCADGPDLLVAAGAHLTLSQHVEAFTRQQLLDQIKAAKAYYKKSYSNNLTKYLIGLVKGGKFNEPSTGTYSLAADTRKDLEARLASRT